MLRMFHPMKPP